jgi:hypothetical protein
MNQLRETLLDQEARLTNAQNRSEPNKRQDYQSLAPYQAAVAIEETMEHGDKMSFYRAYSHQASQLAKDFGITEMGARRMMRNAYQASEGKELLDWGKELDDKHYKPQIEAEKQQRSTQRESATDQKSQRIEQDSAITDAPLSQPSMNFDRSR